jgi:hypothetical protein
MSIAKANFLEYRSFTVRLFRHLSIEMATFLAKEDTHYHPDKRTMQIDTFKRYIDQILNQDWWIRIDTRAPECTYYFGPFAYREEAKKSQIGYVEDLASEGAKEIVINIEKNSPQKLTIHDCD